MTDQTNKSRLREAQKQVAIVWQKTESPKTRVRLEEISRRLEELNR